MEQNNDALEFVNPERGELVLAVAISLIGMLLFFLSFGLITHNKIGLPLGLVGLMFALCGAFLAFGTAIRTTILNKQEPCLVITKRIVTGKEIRKAFTPADVKQVDYLKGYEGKQLLTNKGSEINLIMKDGTRIQVLKKWANKYFNFGVNKPLTDDANSIANFLGVPLNTIDVSTLQKGIKNFGAAITSTSRQDTAAVMFSNEKQTQSEHNSPQE